MNNLPPPSRELIQAVIETLNQGEALLSQLGDETFTRKLPMAFNASVGGHYRHCLDHFRNLLAAADAGDLNYDHRERGTLVELDRFAALVGRPYRLFDYEGAPDAERVIVCLGSGAGALGEAVEALVAQGQKVGLLKVRLYRPFDAGAFQLKVMSRPFRDASTLGLRTGPYGITWLDGADSAPS